MMKIGQNKSPLPTSKTSAPSTVAPTSQNQAVSRGVNTPAPNAWKNPSEAAQQSTQKMPSGQSTPSRDDKKADLDLGGEKFPITHFNPQLNGARFSQSPGAAPHETAIGKESLPQNPAQNPPGKHQQDGVYLGWNSGKGEVMNLGQAGDKKFFATAPLNGCALIVGGPQNGPTVMHANYDSPALMQGLGTMSPGQAHKHQLGVYQGAYQKISDQATAGGHVPADNKVVFDPSKYLQPGSGISSINVFGNKGDDGNWTMNYSATKTTQQEPGWLGKMTGAKPTTQQTPITGQLWPKEDLGPLQGA